MIFWKDGASAYLDDVAYYANQTDLRPNLENDQTLTVHTVFMFGDEEFADTLLRKAAANGGGMYYKAKEADEISRALRNIFEEITQEPATSSSVAVTSKANSSAERIYIAY